MSEQRATDLESNSSVDLEDYVTEEESDEAQANSTIYKKDAINPAKRRRLEEMREERELMRDIQDVFDDYDFDE